MISAEEGVRLIKSESERLSSHFETLPPDAWERPSSCEGWTVADVVAHLVWLAEDYYGIAVVRGLRGDESYPEGLSRAGRAESAATDETMALLAVARRQSLGDQLLPAFQEAFRQFTDRLTGIGPQDWEKPIHHPNGVRTVESYVPGMIQELVLHEWDIRSSLEPSPSLSGNGLPYIMERVPQRSTPWKFPFATRSTSVGRTYYRFELTGAHPGKWDVVVEDNKARMEVAGETAAGLSLSGDTSTFVLLMYGRLNLASAIAAGSMTAEGNQELVPDFDRWLTGG
ncbi:MAG: maleylpyruvate isomerase N-terminal domain-containing protein [Dehalococcoidia bacterium]